MDEFADRWECPLCGFAEYKTEKEGETE